MSDPFEAEALGHLRALTQNPSATFRDGQLDAIRQLVEHRDEFHCGRMILTHLGEEMVDYRDACEFETADDGLVVDL